MKAKICLSILALTGVVLSANLADAQTYQPSNRTPVADPTLGTQVSGSSNNFNITGGLSRGQNLFHSFQDFSVPTNGSVTFANPNADRSIITRVTGNLFSDLNGKIDTNGANFFLINPIGIVFGNNVRLNVGKIFVGSTANGLDLVDAQSKIYTFGTKNINDAPFFSIDPNAIFNPARLIIGTSGNKGIENYGNLETINQSQYIGLIGGNINFNRGRVTALGGRIDLGGLSAPGTVSLDTEGNMLRAQFPNDVGRGDVSFSSQSKVFVAGTGGGDIAISARNLKLSSGSLIGGGIEEGLGTPQAVGGDIKINATGDMVLMGTDTAIANKVRSNSQGNAGNIKIDVGSLSLGDGAIVTASTFGLGNAGNVKVIAKNAISLTNGAQIFSSVEPGSIGKGGNIEIAGGSLSLRDGGKLNTITSGEFNNQPAGKGDAGNVTIKVTGAVDITSTNPSFPSAIFSNTDSEVEGNGGNITIDAGSLSLRGGGAGLKTQVFGTGNGGNISINVGSFSLGDGAVITASIFGTGNAGNVKVTAKDSVSLRNGAQIFSSVEQDAIGNGGNIVIDAGSFSLGDGAEIAVSTFGTGNAGNVKVTARDAVSLTSDARIFSSVEQGGIGKGGNVEINAASLSIRDGARIIVVTSSALDNQPAGKGDAGTVTINVTGAMDIGGAGGKDFSAIFSSINAGAEGTGGNITIEAGSLSLEDNALVQSSTFGTGNAGNVKVKALGAVSVANNSKFLSSIEAGGIGNGGNISIEAGSVSLQDRAELRSSSFGIGNAGNIFSFSNILTLDNSQISSATNSFTGGNINLLTNDYLLMQNNSNISTNSTSILNDGNGGNITINSPSIVATPGNNDISANAFAGTGGRVNINSRGRLFGIGFRLKGQESPITNDITNSSKLGQDGTININTLGLDPGTDATQLPAIPTDASNQISQVCSTNNRQNKFTITGRGGLPKNAYDLLASDVTWQDTRAIATRPLVVSNAIEPTQKLAPPAIGWSFDSQGKVTFIAAEAQGQPTGTRVVCPNEGGR
jgi:filamentous hemagglutinin family protein